jgi:hypothetical protein
MAMMLMAINSSTAVSPRVQRKGLHSQSLIKTNEFMFSIIYLSMRYVKRFLIHKFRYAPENKPEQRWRGVAPIICRLAGH